MAALDGPRLVDNDQIAQASLHNPLPTYLRAYVWPFTILWPIFLAFYFNQNLYDDYIDGQEWTFVWVVTIGSLQALAWLSTKWSVNVDTSFTCTKATTVDDARLIKIMPAINSGAPAICKIERKKEGASTELSFLFQKRRFVWWADRKVFAPLTYLLDEDVKPKIGYFQKSRGLTTQTEVEKLQKHYGDNTFDIPVPTFGELWKEHAVAPFFIFQLFCVGLWLLDDYWYYSLFTLLMLVAF